VERTRYRMQLALGLLTALIGLVMLVSTVARGGGPTAVGIVAGVIFTALGCARLYLAIGPRSHRRDL
jgi:uncharacterized membrane protein HdeD (DUF308 family)